MSPRSILLAAGCLIAAACTNPAEPDTTNIETDALTESNFAFDRLPPSDLTPMPVAEGAGGRLGYEAQCLFLEGDGGQRIGLVLPHSTTFDGTALTGTSSAPTGERLRYDLGEFASFPGKLVENPGGQYRCQTPLILLVNVL